MKYTRYIDDLTFSTKSLITQQIVDEILNVIRSSPFQFHHRKTLMNIGPTEVTGVVVLNNSLAAPENKLRTLSQLEPDTNQAKGLKAYINAIRSA